MENQQNLIRQFLLQQLAVNYQQQAPTRDNSMSLTITQAELNLIITQKIQNMINNKQSLLGSTLQNINNNAKMEYQKNELVKINMYKEINQLKIKLNAEVALTKLYQHDIAYINSKMFLISQSITTLLQNIRDSFQIKLSSQKIIINQPQQQQLIMTQINNMNKFQEKQKMLVQICTAVEKSKKVLNKFKLSSGIKKLSLSQTAIQKQKQQQNFGHRRQISQGLFNINDNGNDSGENTDNSDSNESLIGKKIWKIIYDLQYLMPTLKKQLDFLKQQCIKFQPSNKIISLALVLVLKKYKQTLKKPNVFLIKNYICSILMHLQIEIPIELIQSLKPFKILYTNQQLIKINQQNENLLKSIKAKQFMKIDNQ